MDPLVAKAKTILNHLSELFKSHPATHQWSKDTEPITQDPNLLDIETVKSITERARQLLSEEPNVLSLQSPVVVVGDIHGQCCDLINVFDYTAGSDLVCPPTSPDNSRPTVPHVDVEKSVMPISMHRLQERCGSQRDGAEEREEAGETDDAQSSTQSSDGGEESLKLTPTCNHKYLFLGDYVDRGNHSCECILFLLALKVAYPDRILLLRGNHECRSVTSRVYDDGLSFCAECESKISMDGYDCFMKVFDALPLAAVVENKLGRWFCCHGGLGPKVKTIAQLQELDRFTEPPITGPLCDLLWSDPLLEEVLGYKLSDQQFTEFLELEYLPNPPRGCAYLYGYGALQPFLQQNNLLGIIRAHQCKEEGVSFTYQGDRASIFTFPYVTTVFSAANYCGTHGNKAAVMVFVHDDVQVVKISPSGDSWVEKAPYLPPEPTKRESNLKRETVPETPGAPAATPPVSPPGTTDLFSPDVSTEPTTDVILRSPKVKISEEKKRKLSNRRAVLNVQKKEEETGLEEIKEEGEQEEKEEQPVISPKRSLTVNYGFLRPHEGASYLRRQSLSMLRQGHTGERGSRRFRAALRRDSIYEEHPGWNSIRRVGKTIGRVQLARKVSLEKTPESDTKTNLESREGATSTKSPHDQATLALTQSISKSLLTNVGENDSKQLKLMFDSIDKNQDGQLSLKELEEFALELGKTHPETVGAEVDRILKEMDEDNNGFVSFEEFTHYIAALSLIGTTNESAGETEQSPSTVESICDIQQH